VSVEIRPWELMRFSAEIYRDAFRVGSRGWMVSVARPLFSVPDHLPVDPRPHRRATANRVTDFLSTRSRFDYLALETLADYVGSQHIEITLREPLPRQVWADYLMVADKHGGAPVSSSRSTPGSDIGTRAGRRARI